MDTFVKQPNDVLDYDVEMTNWFAGIEGDDIESVDISISCLAEEIPTLIAGPVPHRDYVLMGAQPVRFKVWLSGGTPYMDYKVTCVIRTEQDRVKEVEFKIKVRDR